MTKIKSCAIALRGQNEVYREGELVSGTVILDVLEPLTVKSVRIYCFGESLTKWSKEFSRDWNSYNIGYEKYFGQTITCFGKKVSEDGPNVQLSCGVHRWNFSFRVRRGGIPSSFEGEYGAVRWWLKVEVDKPFPSINNTWYKAFTILSKLDLNEAVYNVPMTQTREKVISKTLGIGNAGRLRLTARTDKFGYCAGETIHIFIEAKNDSTKDLEKIGINFIQRVTYKANDDEKIVNLGLVAMETEVAVGKEQTVTLNDVKVKIPSVPPSTRKNTCHIICVTYLIKVQVQVPWGFNLEVCLPVAIGTIPRGKSVQPPQQCDALELDARRTITYTRCEMGITQCTKSHNNFVNFPYTPMCAYLPEGSASLAVSAPPIAPTASAAATPNVKSQNVLQKVQEKGKQSEVPLKNVPERATTPVNPTAPPTEMVLPPTYEDVLRMDQEQQARSAQPANANSATSGPPMNPCAFLLMRFSDLMLGEFRNLLQKEQVSLKEYTAYIAAISPQPITSFKSSNSVWPERTAIAILTFPSITIAEEWFFSLAGQNLPWLNSCDVAISPGKWHFPTEEDLAFSLSVLQVKDDAREEEINSFVQKTGQTYSNFRKRSAGLLAIACSKDLKMLSGTWVTSGVTTLVLNVWPRLSNYFHYCDLCSSDAKEKSKQKASTPTPYNTLTVVFVSENVSSLNTQIASQSLDACNGDASSGSTASDPNEDQTEDLLTEEERLTSQQRPSEPED